MRFKGGIDKCLLLIAVLALPFCCLGQSFSEDMGKIMRHYKEGNVSFRMKYLFFPFDSVKKATDSLSIKCYMSDGNYCYKISSRAGSYEYVKNDKYYFVVDNAESALAVRKSSNAQGQLWDMSRLDSIMRSASTTVTYKNLGGGQGEYNIRLPQGPWNMISIVFNKDTYRLISMHMYSANKGKMYGEAFSKPVIAVYYANYSTGAFDKSLFDEERFFNDNSKSIVLNDTYKKYKLLDYIYKMKAKS